MQETLFPGLLFWRYVNLTLYGSVVLMVLERLLRRGWQRSRGHTFFTSRGFLVAVRNRAPQWQCIGAEASARKSKIIFLYTVKAA